MEQFAFVRPVSSPNPFRFMGQVGVAVIRVRSKDFWTVGVCFDSSWGDEKEWAPVVNKKGDLISDPWNATEMLEVEEFINKGAAWGIYFEDELEVLNEHVGTTLDSLINEDVVVS